VGQYLSKGNTCIDIIWPTMDMSLKYLVSPFPET
jgi:hypothetical protein